jgi:hypothetical protein
METYSKLKRFYQRFIQEWVVCGNPTVAMRKLRPKSKRPKELSYKLRQRPEIMQGYAEYAAQFDEETTGYVRAVKRKLANCANAVRIEAVGPDGKLVPREKWPDGMEDCVEGFELDPTTEKVTKIKLASLTEARRLFLESQKVLVRRNSLEGPDGRALPAAVARLMIVTQEEAKNLDAELDAEV